jgi:hypothetical protein
VIQIEQPLSHESQTTLGILVRFSLRLLVLAPFAAFAKIGFLTAFSSLLAVTSCCCAIVGNLRRENPFGPVFTYFDEAAAYGCLSAVIWQLA